MRFSLNDNVVDYLSLVGPRAIFRINELMVNMLNAVVKVANSGYTLIYAVHKHADVSSLFTIKHSSLSSLIGTRTDNYHFGILSVEPAEEKAQQGTAIRKHDQNL